MKVRRAGKIGVASFGLACCALIWSQAAQAQVKLEQKYIEGQKLKYKTTSKMHQTLTLMGMEIETTDERSLVTLHTTGKRRGDSTLPVERKVESLRAEMALPGGINVKYDTTDPNAKIDDPNFAFLGNILKMAGEVVYTVVLDDHNKVKAIEGTEKLQEKVEKLGPPASDLLSKQFDSEKLKKSFEQESQILPDVLARPGESWERTRTVEIGGGQTLSFRKKYEYKGTEKKGAKELDKISSKVLEVKFTIEPDSKLPLKAIKSDLKPDSSEETILFDREEGHVVSSTDKIRIKGDLTFSANGQELPSTLDLTIETTTELQPAAK
jgi:Family of unknown function (DUF6263)